MNFKKLKIEGEIGKMNLKTNKLKNSVINVNSQNGITLIALVVTIVVLLILAGVSINAVFSDNGIIKRAQDAQNKMDEAGQKDLNSINELNNWIENQTGDGDNSNSTGTWTQNKTTVTDGTTTYTVGDSYEYNCGVEGYKGGWKILGAENGKLLIMSTVDIGQLGLKGISGDGTTSYPAGYTNGIAKLNEMCAPYGKNARSIKVEDINRVTGYVPEHQTISITSENKYYYDNDIANQQSTADGSNVNSPAAYAGKYGLATALGITDNSPITGNSSYNYFPNTLTESETGETVGIATDSAAYEMIFGNYADMSSNKGNHYWLATTIVYAGPNIADLGIFRVLYYGRVYNEYFWYSAYGEWSNIMGVRAVVPL